jgi:hypothetical protein
MTQLGNCQRWGYRSSLSSPSTLSSADAIFANSVPARDKERIDGQNENKSEARQDKADQE